MRDRLRTTVTFPRFAALTTALTLTLVSLGVYTAATGSGLACSAQWPLCDGGVLPQTVPSFIEWFHRLVAMVTGFLIVGTAVWAWRATDRRTAATATVAAVLLPLQVSIGAVTVTLSGMFPGGYSPPVQGAHLLVALAIFTALTVTTLRAFAGEHADPPAERAGSALATALVVLVAAALFSRLLPVVTYAPASQAAFFGVTLALFATLVGAIRWLGLADRRLDQGLAGLAAACVFVAMVLGRDLVAYTPTVRLVNAAAFVVAFLAVAVAAWRVRDAASRARTHGAVGD